MWHIHCIHFAQCNEQRDLFILEIGKVWDAWGDKVMNKFWDSNCRGPWKNWSIGSFDCMLCTPSNQCHEAWHRDILRARIPGKFKGSTEAVMQDSLPQLIRFDGYLKPNKINLKACMLYSNFTLQIP